MQMMKYLGTFWSDMHQIGWPEKSSPTPYSINDDDDEYIDIEVNPSPQNLDEFGSFQITTFPATHLFYKGKLQIVHYNLLQSTTTTTKALNSIEENDDFIVMDFASSSPPPKTNNNPHKSWLSDKLEPVKKSGISKRLQAFLRSLFGKSGNYYCKDVSSAKAPQFNIIPEKLCKDSQRSFSFSSVETTKWSSPIKCLDFNELKFHKRSFSFTTSDIEGPIEAAISHCKNSQASLAGHFAFSTPNSKYYNQISSSLDI